MDIEKLATSAVEISISTTDCLSAFINSGDKEPAFDGKIYMYKNKTHSKNNLIAPVSVQVKGKQCDDISKNKITYSIKMSDLRIYYANGGVMFFVVLIKTDTAATKIFFADLLPVKLKNLLSDKKTQSVELKEFPSKPKHKESIFRNFLVNSQKQISFVKSNSFLSFEDLNKMSVNKITTSFYADEDVNENNYIQSLLKAEDVYCYAELEDSNISLPFDSSMSVLHAQKEVSATISVNGIPFYDKYLYIVKKDDSIIKIGKSLTIELNKCRATYNLTENLRDIVVDVDFLTQTMLNKSFEINGKKIPFGNSNDFVEAQQSLLNYHKKVVQVLDYLNVKSNIKISELTDMDKRNLSTLVTAFIDKKKVKGIELENPLIFMNILNINLLLVVISDDNNPDEAKIYDFSQMQDKFVTAQEEDGKYFPISQYVLLKKDDYLQYSNIRYDVILKSFQDCYSVDNPIIIEGANKVLLDLLSVYDENKEKKNEILSAAKDLAQWLLELNNAAPFQLNLLQTIRREREFTKEEKDILISIVFDNENPKEILFAANLLLDNQDVATRYFEQLNSAIQEQYKQFPIYQFKKS